MVNDDDGCEVVAVVDVAVVVEPYDFVDLLDVTIGLLGRMTGVSGVFGIDGIFLTFVVLVVIINLYFYVRKRFKSYVWQNVLLVCDGDESKNITKTKLMLYSAGYLY